MSLLYLCVLLIGGDRLDKAASMVGWRRGLRQRNMTPCSSPNGVEENDIHVSLRWFADSLDVQALIAPLLLRMQSSITRGIFPPSLGEKLQKETPRFWAWTQAVCKDPAILNGWDEEKVHGKLMVGVEKKRAEMEAAE